MLRPAYKLTIGEKEVDTTQDAKASTVVDLTVHLDMETPADSLTVLLGQVNGLSPSRGDDATVSLGYSDDGGLTQVMAGSVTHVELDVTTKRVVAHSPAEILLRSFTENTYESKTAGEIVSDLADQASVDVDTADDGITFPAYVIDGQRSFCHHMKELANLCGFDLYFNSDGKLVFEEFASGKAVHVFQYAKDIVAWSDSRASALAGTVEAWGESPTDSQGADSWAWLTKDFSGSKGTSGSGDPRYLLERPALRTGKAAQTAADSAHTAFQRRTLQGRLVTLGLAEVKLGDSIQLRGMADGSLNKNFQVRSVTHRISKSRGFTTSIGFRAIQT